MSDTVDAVKGITSKAFAGVGSGVFGFEAVTNYALLSSVDSQLVLGLLGVGFLMAGIQVSLSIVEDVGDL